MVALDSLPTDACVDPVGLRVKHFRSTENQEEDRSIDSVDPFELPDEAESEMTSSSLGSDIFPAPNSCSSAEFRRRLIRFSPSDPSPNLTVVLAVRSEIRVVDGPISTSSPKPSPCSPGGASSRFARVESVARFKAGCDVYEEVDKSRSFVPDPADEEDRCQTDCDRDRDADSYPGPDQVGISSCVPVNGERAAEDRNEGDGDGMGEGSGDPAGLAKTPVEGDKRESVIRVVQTVNESEGVCLLSEVVPLAML